MLRFSPCFEAATSYPFPRNDFSFVFCNGTSLPIVDSRFNMDGDGDGISEGEMILSEIGDILILDGVTVMKLREYTDANGISADLLSEPLTPILSIGSNASPIQLSRKYAPLIAQKRLIVPVMKCLVKNMEIVYAPLISGYGSVVANAQPCVGTEIETFITYLGPAEMKIMHDTEGGYDFSKLISCPVRVGKKWARELKLYICSDGSVADPAEKHRFFAMKEIRARGRVFSELSQPEMQRRVMAMILGKRAEEISDDDLRLWVETNISNDEIRYKNVKILREKFSARIRFDDEHLISTIADY